MSTGENHFDVVVIGAGPAGSTLAALLAGRGVRVALVDRATFPRDKVCGEFLSYDSLPVLDAMGLLSIFDDRGAERIRRCVVRARARTYGFDLPSPARGISRRLLDATLFEHAVSLGATPLAGWGADDIRRGELTVVDVRGAEGELRSLFARVVVGAWGRWGRLDQTLGRAFVTNRSQRHFGYKRHFVRRNDIDGVIHLYSYERGYLGVSNVESDRTNVCGLVHADRIRDLKGGWEQFVENLSLESEDLRDLFTTSRPAQEGFLSSDPVIFAARSPVQSGIIMIGDSGGIIDPLTGNGMTMGIQSALLAAGSVIQILGGGRFAEGAIDRYQAAWHAWFDDRLAWSRRTAWLLGRPRVLRAAIGAVRSPRAGSFLLEKTRARLDLVEHLVEAWFQRR